MSSVADELGMDWRIAHDAFVAYADEVLPAGPPPVRVLGIDETRRGKGKYEIDTSTGVKAWGLFRVGREAGFWLTPGGMRGCRRIVCGVCGFRYSGSRTRSGRRA